MKSFSYEVLVDNKLFLFLFIFILFPSIKKYMDQSSTNNKVKLNNLCARLNTYKINNIYLESFLLSMYIFFSIFIFFILRIHYLNNSMDTILLNKVSIDYLFIYKISLYFITVIYYLKILEQLFHKNIIKMHFYLHQYEWYHEGISENIRHSFNWVNQKLIDISTFFYRLKQFPDDYIKGSKYMDDSIEIQENRKKDLTYKLILLLNKYPKVSVFFDYMDNLIYKIPITSKLFRYLPYSLCVMTCIYDILNYNFHWIFYTFLFLLIIQNIRKIRRFYYTKDILCDGTISSYLYNKENDVYLLESLLEEYINSNHTRALVIELENQWEHKRTLNKALRQNMLLLLFFGVLYFYIYDAKYLINSTIALYKVFLLWFIIIYIIHDLYNKYSLNYKTDHFSYKWIFTILAIFLASSMIYIMLKNKITLFPSEIILSLSDSIIIQEIFSLEDKLSHIKRYLNYIEKLNLITSEKNNHVFIVLQDMLKNEINISMEELITLSKHLIYKDHDILETRTFMHEIKQLVNSLWKALWH